MSSERDSIYLAHILECIERIQNYTENNIDLEQVWSAVILYLPSLELAIKRLATSLSQDNN